MRTFVVERWQRTEIERGARPSEQIERSILILCGVELAGESVGSTIEREEVGVGKERANTFFAGAVDQRYVGIEKIE
jgi:hypothetical protein